MKTIHDLKRSHENKQKVESVNTLTKNYLSKKATDESLNEIREQQIELIEWGLCLKCKAVTRHEGSSLSKRLRSQPPKPPRPPRRPVHN